MRATRNALVLIAAVALIFVFALRDRLGVVQAPPAAPRAPIYAQGPEPNARLKRLEPLPDGRAVAVFTLEASAPLTVHLYRGQPGSPPWLAYSFLRERDGGGTWVPPMDDCCDEAMYEESLAAGERLEVAMLIYDYSAWPEGSMVRLVGPDRLLSEPFELGPARCKRAGCFERAYTEAAAQLAETLRERGLTGPVTRAEDPALALVEQLHASALRSCCDADEEARFTLAHFRLTGDLVTTYIPSEMCSSHPQLTIDMVEETPYAINSQGTLHLVGEPAIVIPTPAGPAQLRYQEHNVNAPEALRERFTRLLLDEPEAPSSP